MLLSLKSKLCEVCSLPGHGNHFEVFTCRACAVFFKRALESKMNRKPCKFKGNCAIFDGLKYPCKACRLTKCLQVRMRKKKLEASTLQISTSLEKFCGRPSLIIFTDNSSKSRTFIDVRNLISTGAQLLSAGCPSPLQKSSSLEKMSLAFENPQLDFTGGVKLDKVTRHQVKELFEFDFLTTAKWLTHFDDFVQLPNEMQMQLLQSTWHVWSRLYRILRTAAHWNNNENIDKNEVFICKNNYIDMKNTEFDMSWMTEYSLEQIEYFMDNDESELIESAENLNLSSIELTFMFGHLCFEYAAKRFPGEISEVCEKFQHVLATDLHNYYIANSKDYKKQCNYAGRLAKILKINQEILRSIRQMREKTKIARMFDIFTAEFSHPEMFVDTGCS